MHYVCFVFVRPPVAGESLEDVLARALDPYEGTEWDWCQVGGRFTGLLSGGEYSPEQDPKNQKPCTYCLGRGIRSDEVGVALGFPTKELPPEIGEKVGRTTGWCNGCNGTGTMTVWCTQWARTRWDVQPAREALDQLHVHIPYAFIDTDGERHAREVYLPVTSENTLGTFQATPNYQDEYVAAIEQARDENALVVVVDCHT